MDTDVWEYNCKGVAKRRLKSDIPPVMASISSEVQSNHDHLFNKCGIGKLTRVNL